MKWTGYVVGILLIAGLSTAGMASVLTGGSITLTPSATSVGLGGTVTIDVDILLVGTFDSNDGFSSCTTDVEALTNTAFDNLVLNSDFFDYLSPLSGATEITGGGDLTVKALGNTLFGGTETWIPAGYGVDTSFTLVSFDVTFSAMGTYVLTPAALAPAINEVGIITGASIGATAGSASIDVIPEPTTLVLVGSMLIAPFVRRRV